MHAALVVATSIPTAVTQTATTVLTVQVEAAVTAPAAITPASMEAPWAPLASVVPSECSLIVSA